MSSILRHFDVLTKQGLKVIPLRQNSKAPVYKNWNKKWNLESTREKFEAFPNSNIGLLLGDIVDVEGDSEEANQIILDLIKDYPHPTYKSSKSIHHLFLTPDPFLRRFCWKEIEFRGHGHQSVLPPSKINETTYKWLSGFKFPVPPMPCELIRFFHQKRQQKNKKIRLKINHKKIHCYTCRKVFFLHKKRLELEIESFRILNKRWECNKCRDVDIRSACRLLRAGVDKNIVITDGYRHH
jgi:hypothetical protein